MIIGVGTDIVALKDIKIKREHLARWMSEAELVLFDAKTDIKKTEFAAGRWAAKESIYKALDVKIDDYKLIEVLKNEDGSPFCNIDGYRVCISISHNKEYAVAYCTIEKA